MTETTVVESGKLSPTKRKPKGLKPSPELATTELTKTKVELDTQKPSVDSGDQTEVAVSGEFSVPPRKKSKNVDVSTAVESVSLLEESTDVEVKEGPESERMVRAASEAGVGEDSELLQNIRKTKVQERPQEFVSTEPTKAESRTPKPEEAKPSKMTPEETITQSTVTDSGKVLQSAVSSEPSDVPDAADQNQAQPTTETQKRYLVLDLPEVGFTQTWQIKSDQPEAETVVENDSIQPTSAVFAVAQPHKAETEFSVKTTSDQEIMKPNEMDGQLKLSQTAQERPKEDMEVNSARKEEIRKGVEVKVITRTDVQKEENTTVTTDQQPQMETQSKAETKSKDTTSTDVQPEKTAVEMTSRDEQESVNKPQDSVAKRDSAQPTATQPSEALTASAQKVLSEQETPKSARDSEPKSLDQVPPLTSLTEAEKSTVPENKSAATADVTPEKSAVEKTMTKVQVPQKDSAQPTSAVSETEFIEISIYEKDIATPGQTETKTELLRTAQDRPAEVKGDRVQEKLADVPKPPEEKLVRVEKILMGPQMNVLQLDIPASLEDQEKTFVTIVKETRVENQDKTQTEVKPEMTTVETSMKVQEISTERQETQTKSTPPSQVGTTLTEISVSGQDTVTPSETVIKVELMTTTRKGDVQEVSKDDVHDAPHGLDEKPERVVKIQKEAEISVTIAKEPLTGAVQTSIQSEQMPDNKEKTTSDVQPERVAVVMTKVQEISSERQEDVAESDANQSTVSAPAQPLSGPGAESVRISSSKQDEAKPNQTVTQLELLKTTQEGPKEVKDQGDGHDAPTSLDETSVKKGDVVTTVREYTTVTVGKEPGMKSSIQFETVKESVAGTPGDVQPDKSAVQTIGAEERESFTDRPSEPTVVLRDQTETTEAKENKTKDQETKEKRTSEEEEKEKTAVVEKTPLRTVTTSGDATPQVDKPDEMSPATAQTAQKPPANVTAGELTPMEVSPAQEDKAPAEASPVLTEKPDLEAREETAMGNVFMEIQQLAGTGPSSQLIEGKQLEDTAEALVTPTSDLGNHLSRLVSKVLSCKNFPTELDPAAMAQQLEQAKECQETAQAQLSLLAPLRGADAEKKDALELVEDQWSTAAQDAAAVIQSKEEQLHLVSDYCKRTQAAKTALDRLTAELDAVETSPEESSSKEAERLCSLQRNMEQSKPELEEMFTTYTKLCPLLSRSERATAQTEQKNLQEKWRGLERAVERTLYRTNISSHETSRLLTVISSLRKHLETIGKDLEGKSPSGSAWNCKKAQELMVANAEVKAARQKHLHLQQLSEELVPSSRWEKETKEVQQELQNVNDQLCHTEELVSSQTQNSSNPIMEKIIVVMRDGLAWAKQTESEIEGRRRRVALLPEEVHRQLRDLKKLQSEVMAKQGQLESLVEEVTELLPQLDEAEEVPMVRSSLRSLEELSKSTTDKLAKAVREMESGLQTREKLSEQIADLDSWVVAHLHREASRNADEELRSSTEYERRVRQIQETLTEAEKQAAVCKALLTKSKDISSELSTTENCQLFDRLTNLQEDIQAISSYEKTNKKELDELTQTVESCKKDLVTVEKSLRQMLVDLSRHRYPITSESLQALEPFKHLILEHKSQVDLLQPWIPREKSKELYSVISELHKKMATLETKSREHERYLYLRQCVEDLRENTQDQVPQTKDDSKEPEEKYKLCQSLLVQFPLIKYLSQEAQSKLQMISADLYPSQLSTEKQRLKQNEDSLDTLEMTLSNNLGIIERNLLKELDLESEKKATQGFLWRTQQELQKYPVLEPNEDAIRKEYQRITTLRKTVESRIRALEVLGQKRGTRRGSISKNLTDLKNAVIRDCDSHMVNVLKARESLRSYTSAVKQAVQFLRDVEVSLLPPQGSAGLCSDRLEETQQALASLQQQFQTHVEQLQSQVALHPYLSPQKVEQLQENILSQLLVRMSTLQAKGHIRLESLSRCAENHRKYTKCYDEILHDVKSAESSLLRVISQKVTCLADCKDQQAELEALSEEMEALQRRLEELKEWCPEQSCCGGRGSMVTAVWKRILRLRRCTYELTARSKRRITEWTEITDSVEKASAVLEQVEAELPDSSRAKASTEELQDLLQTWEQYQDRLDCEHRALSALELRTARLQGVPAHLEKAPPTPLCQRLQAMQGRYGSVKQRSREGLEAARTELEQREKLREELTGVRVWLQAADSVLSEMEQSSSTEELQEVHSQLCTQKALLQRIMETLKMNYSDMYSLVPVEIDGQLQEVKQSLQQVEVKVGEAVERSGPVHRLGAKLSEIQAGLRSVQKRLEQRSPSTTQAKITQKRVWDELDVWHSCLAALEVDMQDLEKPDETLSLMEKLVEVQQLHSQLAKQAEQRTTLISKIQTWLQEHQEMIKSSKSWMAEAQTWLAAPCTYTTAKCLRSHVDSLQMVLNDSAQIRTTLQGFSSVLNEMSQVCEVSTLQEQLQEADRQVADVQESFSAPLSQLEHAAAEVEAIETEVRQMENNVAEIKTILTSPETFPSPREERLKAVEQRIQSMRRTIAEIVKCKPGLCLPEKAEETLTVFAVVDQLQDLLMELEKKVPALFIQQPPTPIQAKAPSAQLPQIVKSSSVDPEKEDSEPGQIRIAHVQADVLTRSGAALLTVEHSSPEQRRSWTPDSPQREHQGVLQAGEAGQKKGSEEQRVEEGGGGVFWWLWDAFLGSSPEEPVATEEAEAASAHGTEQTGEEKQEVEGPTETTEARSSEALSKPLGTVRTQVLPESMVNKASTTKVSKADSGAQQKCVVS